MPAKKKILSNASGTAIITPRLSVAGKKSNLAVLYGLGSLLAVSSALPAYIQSNFLGEHISLQAIGYVMIASNLISIGAILFFPKLIKKLTNYFTTKTVLTLYGTSLLGLAASNGAISAIISIILFSVSSNLVWINMDILIESFSDNSSTGRTRTIYFTFINAGWILSPMASSFLVNKGEYTLSFLVAAILVLPFMAIFISHARGLNHEIEYEHKSLRSAAMRMWKDKNRRNIFFISFLLQLFYSSAVIYIPFHLLHNLGMSWTVLGPIFSVMLAPFLLVEIPAGIIADKYIGEKEMLMAGFIILIVSLFLFYYIDSPVAWIWAGLLFLSRIGAALIESMRESYFFKIVDAKNLVDINIFRTTAPLGYVAASILAVITLEFLPLNYLFLIMSVIMVSGLTLSALLRDTK